MSYSQTFPSFSFGSSHLCSLSAGASEASGGPLSNPDFHTHPDAHNRTHTHLDTKTYKEQPLSNSRYLYTYQYADTCTETQTHTNSNSTRLHSPKDDAHSKNIAKLPDVLRASRSFCQDRFFLRVLTLFKGS